jgi:HD-GYP domain-containing protein (c-di-GMP phosphodiesterase class II)
MPRRDAIHYFTGSPLAARLAKRLASQFTIRPAKEALAWWNRVKKSVIEIKSPAVWLLEGKRGPQGRTAQLALANPNLRLIGVVPTERDLPQRTPREFFAVLAGDTSPALARRVVATTFADIRHVAAQRSATGQRRRAERENAELHRIGVALSSERDLDRLLSLILRKVRETTSADAGSIYLMEESASGERQLRFKLTQNDSVDFPFSEFMLPLTEESMAGYAALRGKTVYLADAYRVPARLPFRFNPSFDRHAGYHTRSVLAVPMKNVSGEVLGVLQLINCKRRRAARLSSASALRHEVIAFPAHAVRLAQSLASQAAVAYENSRLYRAIETLFEGFVKASVTAIEQRDPTTSGHSLRVTALTEGLAEIVDRADTGSYADVRFSAEQMREIRYAALLHDFGKVGVREEVLVKAKKLYPLQLDLIRERFAYIRKEMEARIAGQKVEALLSEGRAGAAGRLAGLDNELAAYLRELDDFLRLIISINEPSLLGEEASERLLEIARRTFPDAAGAERPYLLPDEIRLLSIPRGTLDPGERAQIESHVTHSFHFLAQIPWTKTLHRIPEIARAHHEKLNGTGYPRQLRGREIPLPARMMTICDIFDALHASDRPYKKAVPLDRALAILESMVREAQLDADLFRMFVDARVYERVEG